MTPLRGSWINTCSDTHTFVDWLVGSSIQQFQRLRGYPGWRAKHTVIYIGRLDPSTVGNYRDGGYLSCEAIRHGWTDEQYADYLNSRSDWCMSMTTPWGRWERFEHIQKQRHAIYQPPIPANKIYEFNTAMHSAAWRHFGRLYDKGQLIDIPRNAIERVGNRHYSRLLDASMWRTVCSGAGAEMTRRTFRQIGCPVMAKQLYFELHDERVPPAVVSRAGSVYSRVGGNDDKL